MPKSLSVILDSPCLVVLAALLLGGCGGRSVPPPPPSLSVDAYRDTIQSLGRNQQEGIHVSVAGLRQAEGGVYLDLVLVGSAESFDERTAVAHFVHRLQYSAPQPSTDLVMRPLRIANDVGSLVTLLDTVARPQDYGTHGRGFNLAPPYIPPDATTSPVRVRVGSSSSGAPIYIQPVALRTQSPVLPGKYVVTLDESLSRSFKGVSVSVDVRPVRVSIVNESAGPPA